MPYQGRKQLGDIWANDDFMMIRGKRLCHNACVRQFIIETIIAFESNRIGFDRPVSHAGHRRHDGAGIDPATQESTQGHIADESNSHRFE